MKAIQFNVTIPRYVTGLALSKLYPSALWSGLSCTSYGEIPDPELPGEEWAIVQTQLGGVCGSDTSAIFLKASPYLSVLTSSSFVFGHENVGAIAEVGRQAGGWKAGQRVVVEPTLWCAPRGFTQLCHFCARGEVNRCERVTQGSLSPGLGIGNCRETSGSWAPYFLAHRSQLYAVPEAISPENAVLIEPFAVGLHAALQNFPKDDDKVLIVGAGSIGLCMLAALRGLGSQAEILVLARHAFQAEAAQRLGASHVITSRDTAEVYGEMAELTGGSVKKPIIGKQVLLGGADLTFECVGSSQSLDDALRLTRNGGRMVVVGVPGIAKGVDWSAIFIQELEVKAAYIYHHAEQFGGRQWKTFDLAIDLMATGKVDLGWMVSHKFRLEEYRQALELTHRRGGQRALKIAFEFG